MNKILLIDEKEFKFKSEYNLTTGRFQNTKLEVKDSKSEYILILKEILKIFEIYRPIELYEHLIIIVENRLRRFEETNYQGVILSDNVNKFYCNLNKLFRKSLESYVSETKKKKINFETLKISKNWKYLNLVKKMDFLKIHLNKFLKIKNYKNLDIKIIRIEKETDIFISIENLTEVDLKNEICLDLEIFFKKNYEESLCFYLETMIDKNLGRRLKV